MSPGIYSSEWHGCYKKIKLVPAITMFLNLYLIVFILKVFSIVIGVYKNYQYIFFYRYVPTFSNQMALGEITL